MATKPASSTDSPIVKLAGVGIIIMGLYGLWSGNDWALQRINELPVQGKPAAAADGQPATPAPAPQVQQASLNPLLIESRAKAAAAGASAVAVDVTQSAATFSTLFGAKKPEENPAKAPLPGQTASAVAAGYPPSPATPAVVAPPPPPDYFPQLVEVLRVEAISHDGAILNGKFYSFGAKLDDWAYPNKEGKLVAPVLASAKGSEAIVTEPEGKRRIRLKL